MSRKVRIGLTRDILDKDGKFIMPGPGLKLLDEMPGVEYEVFSEFLLEVSPEQIRGFDSVITVMPKWTQRTIATNDQLLAVHRTGVGYDMVDVPALTDAGIMLTITPEAVRRPMAVSIITFLLALSMRLFTKDRLTREARWAEKAKYHGVGLIGRTLGSIGVGNIGHEMFRLARPFGMKHIGCDPFITQETVADVDVKLVDMDTILAQSDFLSISCPLNNETFHLIGENELRKMKKTAFLINTARGPVVDEAALIRALKEGWIQGAAIDVFEQEPTPPDNPLLKMDSVIVAPHAIGHTDQTFMVMWDQIMKQVSQIMQGEMPESLVVNREVWARPKFQAKLKKFQEAIK
jgi:phosphoglycerate dehydrogenase-like enzyme